MEKSSDISVSVIVASYNYGRYLRENLESLQRQTFKDFEVIVVDDGSTDDSLAIIDEYVKKDHRFKCLVHEGHANLGLTRSIQKALDLVTGEYVAFCESDDYWHLDYLQKKIDYIKSNLDADVIVSDFTVFGLAEAQVRHYRESEGLVALYKLLRRLKKPKNIFFEMEFTWSFPTFSIVMVRTEALKSVNLNPPSRNGLDIWLWKQLVLRFNTGYVDEPLTYYRRSGESQIQQNEHGRFDYNSYMKELYKTLNLSMPYKMALLFIKLVQTMAMICTNPRQGLAFCFGKLCGRT